MGNISRIREVNTKYCVIYRITAPSGQEYVGQSKDIMNRWWQYQAENYAAMGPQIASSIKVYGVEMHTFEMVEECCKDDLLKREQYYINLWQTVEFGLNCKHGVKVGTNHTEATKATISKSMKGKESPIRGWSWRWNNTIRKNTKWDHSMSARSTINARIALGKFQQRKGRTIRNTQTNEEWISIAQCARNYGVSPATIYDWLKINKNNLIKL